MTTRITENTPVALSLAFFIALFMGGLTFAFNAGSEVKEVKQDVKTLQSQVDKCSEQKKDIDSNTIEVRVLKSNIQEIRRDVKDIRDYLMGEKKQK